jgi:lysozyme family protein
MTRFDRALSVVLSHEGGFANHADDPGGATMYGITAGVLGAWRELGRAATPDEVRHMTLEEAGAIYRAKYWRPEYDLIDSDLAAIKVFDMAVNMGSHQAHVLAQRAVTACGFKAKEDGVIGPMSLAALNSAVPAELLMELCHAQDRFYMDLANVRPALAVFLAGWRERARWPWGDDNSPEGIA